MVNTNYRTDLINQRICDLNRWLNGVLQWGVIYDSENQSINYVVLFIHPNKNDKMSDANLP